MRETDFLDGARALRCRGSRSPAASRARPRSLQLSRFAAQEVKVVLAGQGADEPHGGYGRHQAAGAPAAAASSSRPRAARPAAALARALPRAACARRAARTCSADAGDAERLAAAGRDHRRAGAHARCVGRPGAEAEHERLATARERARATSPDRGLLEQALYLDTHMFLPDGILICNDKMSMAAEPRAARAVPRRRADALRRAHPRHARGSGPRRASGCTGMAMERLLPPEVANRPKHGFATPYDDWLRASLGEEVERRYAPG